MESTLSSKVTVEYHDPSGVFPLISRDLASKLPLRNLNWKSPTRPLRSIGALHVEFVPDTQTEAADPERLQRVDSYGTRPGGNPTATKERRHQIPGLRQTPYLKIYLLRCDDKDIYKASHRQLLHDWIKENAPQSQTSSNVNKTEDHDACEWLILHVVIPDTTAASEPRWTAASKNDPDELVERPSSTAKWPGKSTRTVLDKIRADLNTSSKTTPERIAQIRLLKKDVPPQLLPQTPVTPTYVESPQEQENAWQDLVSKLKTLILMSFDLRVSQYEDDIREKDAQRTLPGWNFCTFFALKEGLARGFESVGLVEDALAIYDELSAGLDAALRDDDSAAAKGTFLGDLNAYRDSLTKLLDDTVHDTNLDQLTSQFQDMFDQPLNLTKKDYRSEIVSSTISLFDFRLYIFARQRTLLLRLGSGTGNIQQARPSSARAGSKDDNLAFSAEVCKRAAIFAATNARALHKGLLDGSANNNHIDSLVESVASSWTYAVLEQVLDETASGDLPFTGTSVDMAPFQPQKHIPATKSRKDASGNFNFPQGANPHPTRTTSLQRSSSSSMQLAPQVIYENERYTKSSSSTTDNITSTGSGVAVLASGRAQLFLMQRRIVEALAVSKGWEAGWASVISRQNLADISLDADEAEGPEHGRPDKTSSTAKLEQFTKALLSAPLSASLTTLEAFRVTYEQLSNLAVSHFATANHTKSADTVMSDLAILKYQLGDFAQAAAYFQKSSSTYMNGGWTYVHGEMLRLYAKCLKELHRKDEYMRVSLTLLGKAIARHQKKSLPIVKGPSSWLDEEAIDVQGVLGELVDFSEELPYNFTTPLSDFFAEVHVGTEILHYADKDGFSLNVSFKHLLEETLTLDRVKLRLTLSIDPSQEIILQSEGPIDSKQGLVNITLHSNMSTYGHFLIDKLVLESKKLHFSHEFQPKIHTTPLGITNASGSDKLVNTTGPSLFVYPHAKSLDASATLIRDVYIDQPRSIIVDLSTGWNDIETLDLRLRSGSAGLRLHTADASILQGKQDNLDTSQAGILGLGTVSPDSKLQIRVPYTTERTLNHVTIKLECLYRTTHGSFTFQRTSTIAVELPLDVDVNDMFKSTALFSRFNIRTTNSIPLKLLNVELEESPGYAVKGLPCSFPMTVFDKQPASLSYKITRKSLDDNGLTSRKEVALALSVEYLRLDEIVFEKLRKSFETAVAESDHSGYSRLLAPMLMEKIKILTPASQLEKAVLLDEIEIPGYKTLGWEMSLGAIPSLHQQDLKQWLQAWHSSNPKLPLATPFPIVPKRITLSVDVPTVDILYTASLTLSPNPQPHPLNTPIPTTLTLSPTTLWSISPPSLPLKFAYTITPPSDTTWLLAGPKRGHFSLTSPTDTTTVPLILIPLKQGVLTLPNVEVAFVNDGEGVVAVTCETDFKSAGEMVRVVREVRTTSVVVRDGVGQGQGYGQQARRFSSTVEAGRASVESGRGMRGVGA